MFPTVFLLPSSVQSLHAVAHASSLSRCLSGPLFVFFHRHLPPCFSRFVVLDCLPSGSIFSSFPMAVALPKTLFIHFLSVFSSFWPASAPLCLRLHVIVMPVVASWCALFPVPRLRCSCIFGFLLSSALFYIFRSPCFVVFGWCIFLCPIFIRLRLVDDDFMVSLRNGRHRRRRFPLFGFWSFFYCFPFLC